MLIAHASNIPYLNGNCKPPGRECRAFPFSITPHPQRSKRGFSGGRAAPSHPKNLFKKRGRGLALTSIGFFTRRFVRGEATVLGATRRFSGAGLRRKSALLHLLPSGAGRFCPTNRG